MSRRTKDFRFNQRRICLLFFLCMVLMVSFHCTLLNAAVKKPKLNYSKETLMVGDVLNLSVSAKGNSIGNVSWTSSDETVAEVNKKGQVTAQSEGTAKITAKLLKGDYSGKKLVCRITVVEKQYTFRYESYLDEHYEKHGIEMGFVSKEEYLEAANRVINNPDALHKLEAEDQDHVYYLEETDEIVFLSQDGYIRTYFKPGGRDYFERQ